MIKKSIKLFCITTAMIVMLTACGGQRNPAEGSSKDDLDNIMEDFSKEILGDSSEDSSQEDLTDSTDYKDGKEAASRDSSVEATTEALETYDLEVTQSQAEKSGEVKDIQTPEDLEQALQSLETDYNRVNWGVHYSPFEELPNFVISVTPYKKYDEYYLLVGLTNMYSEAMDFGGNAQALDEDGNIIGETFLYQTAIGAANTVVSVIPCGETMPDGRIHWEECQIQESDYARYVPWEADYKVTGNPKDGLVVNYDFYSANQEIIRNAEIHILLLDENGFVMDHLMDYIGKQIASGEKYSASLTSYAQEEMLKKVKGIAIFADATAAKE